MMEALAIGLAVYGGVVTFVAAYALWRAIDEREQTRWATDGWDRSNAIITDLRAYIRAMDIELTEARNKLQAFKPFDADGNGKPGGSKPRGKG